ncbi:hypothetical protein GCM10022205_42110 [Spinactinospora alkalitolerans]
MFTPRDREDPVGVSARTFTPSVPSEPTRLVSRRIAMYDTAPSPTTSDDDDEATRALQAALDRRDNGGSTGH